MTRTFWPCLVATVALVAGCMHPRAIEAPAPVQLTPLKTVSTWLGELDAAAR